MSLEETIRDLIEAAWTKGCPKDAENCMENPTKQYCIDCFLKAFLSALRAAGYVKMSEDRSRAWYFPLTSEIAKIQNDTIEVMLTPVPIPGKPGYVEVWRKVIIPKEEVKL